MTRAERVVRLQELLSQGKSLADAAREMGISYSYASELRNDPKGKRRSALRQSYRRPCPNCGRLMDGSSGRGKRAPKYCIRCHGPMTRYWTKERVIEAIQRWEKIYGRPPLSNEWLKPEIRGSGYPTIGTVFGEHGHFPKWSDAIEAAGFERPKIGRKIRRRGMKDQEELFFVFKQVSDEMWSQHRVKASSAQDALSSISKKLGEGSYIVFRAETLFVREVYSSSPFQLMASTPGARQ